MLNVDIQLAQLPLTVADSSIKAHSFLLFSLMSFAIYSFIKSAMWFIITLHVLLECKTLSTVQINRQVRQLTAMLANCICCSKDSLCSLIFLLRFSCLYLLLKCYATKSRSAGTDCRWVPAHFRHWYIWYGSSSICVYKRKRERSTALCVHTVYDRVRDRQCVTVARKANRVCTIHQLPFSRRPFTSSWAPKSLSAAKCFHQQQQSYRKVI